MVTHAYNFGITLLEIFVRKAPTSDAFRDDLMLMEFVSAAFPDKIEQVLDPWLCCWKRNCSLGSCHHQKKTGCV
jgi:hypothetical protein